MIEGRIVVFKSENRFYWLEKNGKKPNTERVLTRIDEEKLRLNVPRIARIRIENGKGEHFERDITDISKTGEILGQMVYTFSWKHEEGGRIDE